MSWWVQSWQSRLGAFRQVLARPGALRFGSHVMFRCGPMCPCWLWRGKAWRHMAVPVGPVPVGYAPSSFCMSGLVRLGRQGLAGSVESRRGLAG